MVREVLFGLGMLWVGFAAGWWLACRFAHDIDEHLAERAASRRYVKAQAVPKRAA